MKNILITGGTGMIGMLLSEKLTAAGHKVAHLTRNKEEGHAYQQFEWDIEKQEMDEEALDFAEVIVHLAGAGVAEKRWTESRKQVIEESRTQSAGLLFKKLSASKRHSVKHFISASAIGYYGMDTGDKLMTESSEPGTDFLAEVTKKWEAAARQVQQLGIPVARLRIGIVLSASGGALPQLAKPIKFGFGAPLGNGDQWMSWIHEEDVVGMFIHLIENRSDTVFNGVAENPVTNQEMTQAVAKQLNRPLILPKVPAFAMKLMLGEMAQMVLGGNKVSAERIKKDGYQFKYSTLEAALKEIYG